MKKINLPNILDIYWADGERGEIFVLRAGKYVKLNSYYEEGRREPRVSLKSLKGKSKKFARGYLVIGAYEGFKDKKLFMYKFKNSDMADTRICNMEWVERYGFIDALRDNEYSLFREKIDRISMEACIAFSKYVDYRLKTVDNLAGYSDKRRKQFFERLMRVNVNEIKSIKDAVDLSFVNLKKS